MRIKERALPLILAIFLLQPLAISNAAATPVSSITDHPTSPAVKTETQYLTTFKNNLHHLAKTGDQTAANSLEHLNNLDKQSLLKLSSLLESASFINSSESTFKELQASPTRRILTLKNGVTVTCDSSQTPFYIKANKSSATVRRISGKIQYSFKGVVLTQTELWGVYETAGRNIKKIIDYDGRLVKNYLPLRRVTVSKHSAHKVGSRFIVFKAKIRIEGVIPSLGLNFMEKEGYHILKGNQLGRVIYNGEG